MSKAIAERAELWNNRKHLPRRLTKTTNEKLLKVIEETGLNNRQIATAADITMTQLSALIQGETDIYTAKGEFDYLHRMPSTGYDFRPHVKRLCNFLCIDPFEVFDCPAVAYEKGKAIRSYALANTANRTEVKTITERNETVALVHKALAMLTTAQRNVLILRYGLDGNGFKTLDECAAIFGVFRERIRQIECKALRNLRNPYILKTLADMR